MQRKSTDFDEHDSASNFFKYVLKESQMIGATTKNFLLMPNKSVKPINYKVNHQRNSYYFGILSKNSSIIIDYVQQKIVE